MAHIFVDSNAVLRWPDGAYMPLQSYANYELEKESQSRTLNSSVPMGRQRQTIHWMVWLRLPLRSNEATSSLSQRDRRHIHSTHERRTHRTNRKWISVNLSLHDWMGFAYSQRLIWLCAVLAHKHTHVLRVRAVEKFFFLLEFNSFCFTFLSTIETVLSIRSYCVLPRCVCLWSRGLGRRRLNSNAFCIYFAISSDRIASQT